MTSLKRRKRRQVMAAKRKSGIVITERLNVRAKAGLDGNVTDIIKRGDLVEIISKVKDKQGSEWYHIPDGYVMSKWIEVKG